jgi:GTP-binding protein
VGREAAQYLGTASTLKKLPAERYPEIALAGRSNVGKSSLINTLIGRKLAPISRTPGKTRSLRFYNTPLKGGDWLTLVDLPGYGWARLPATVRQQWQHLVEGYLDQRSLLKGVALIADLRRGSTELDRQMVSWLRRRQLAFVVVATKVDKLRVGQRRRLLAELAEGVTVNEQDIVQFSARTGEGKKEVFSTFTNLMHD